MIAHLEILRRAVEMDKVPEAVEKLLALGASQEWIDSTLSEMKNSKKP